MLTVSVTLGETPEQAKELARINDLVILWLRTGRLGRYPTVEEAREYPFTDQERAMIASMPINYIAGDAEQIHAEIMRMMTASEADELMITTMLPAPEDRRRTLIDLAAAFGLTGAGVTPFSEDAAQETQHVEG